MSVASKNLFAVLGDEDAAAPAPAPVSSGPVKEVVKSNTTSKKTDAPPARANAARASGNRKAATGNEAAIRDKNVGRSTNRARGGAENDTSRGFKKSASRPDRHSQTGKTDSEKKVNKAWGDNKKKLDDEAAAETLAKEDATETESGNEASSAANVSAAVVEEEVDTTKTLDQYFAELNTKNADLNAPRSARKANEGVEDVKWANANEVKKSDEELVPEARAKALRSKTRKEKTIIEPEVSFTGPSRPSNNNNRERGGNRERGNARGGRRGGNQGPQGQQGRGRAANAAQVKVNITSQSDFPTLGN